jgi:hypothetical protein
MSIPDSETTFASIKYNGKIYRMFNNPMGGEVKEQYENYKEKINYFSSAPWSTVNYLWEVIESKLFLKKIFLKTGTNGCIWNDITDNIFKKEVFANWVNTDLELLVKKEPFLFPKRKRKILILKVKNGIVCDTIEKEEIYELYGLTRILLNYKSIGAFWIYKDKVFSKDQSFEEGTKRNSLIMPSFDIKEVFESIKCKDSELYYFDMDDLPRGIVAFDEKRGVFKIFATEQIIKNPVYQYKVIQNFYLEDQFVEFEKIK